MKMQTSLVNLRLEGTFTFACVVSQAFQPNRMMAMLVIALYCQGEALDALAMPEAPNPKCLRHTCRRCPHLTSTDIQTAV